MSQLSHPYMTTGKTIALTTRTVVSKMIYLLFNTPSRFVIALLYYLLAIVFPFCQSDIHMFFTFLHWVVFLVDLWEFLFNQFWIFIFYFMHCKYSSYHQLPEFSQTHIHWVADAIQPSHSLSSPYPPAFNLSLHQGLFQWFSSSHQVAKVLEFQLQHLSFQWTPRTDLL